MNIRMATEADTEKILNIYAPYVKQTAITFEYEVPSTEEFAGRIRRTLEKYPYLVAEEGGEILGYAYAGRFQPRKAYDWAVETSIYVDQGRKRSGVGGSLHRALEAVLKEQGVLNMNACIAYPAAEDQYLTKNSAEFHSHLGYRWVGEFYRCGYKFGRWYNMVWMEKHIGEHTQNPEKPKALEDIRELIGEKYHIL